MKLDSIIYDQNSLASAIAEQWATESDVFNAMYPSDTATALINGFAAYGAMLQYCLVSAMANCYTSTAFSEAGIYQLAETLGNILHGNEPAQVTVALTKKNFLTMRTTVPANTQFKIDEKKFFNPYAVIIPANNPTVTNISLIQGEWVEVNKISTGLINERFYFSTDFKAAHNYVKVFVNGVEWQVKNSFLEYDKYYVLDVNDINVVVLRTDPEGNSYIRVGDGQLGTLPPSGSNITIQYVSNDGANGNIQETNIEGELISEILLTDNNGHQDTLQLDVVSTSTAFGGFGKQSIATLRYTSPFVFASGHRAVRRQDYNAILQNECGYLTSSVWGEWEESDYVGAYDSIMMNMVYYTGLKSFEHYDYFEIGKLTSGTSFDGTLYTTRGFWGSYALKITNDKDDTSYFIISDNGAHGTLYINNDNLDPRDSLLPEWIAADSPTGVIMSLYDGPQACIVAGGTGYKVGDILELYYEDNGTITDGIYVQVKGVDSTTGYVSEVKLSTIYSGDDLVDLNGLTFTAYDRNTPNLGTKKLKTEGTGCQIKLTIEYLRARSGGEVVETVPLVTTNDLTGSDASATQEHPIENARSDKSDTLFYQSLRAPGLNAPRQIRLNYGDIAKLGQKGIAAIKFKATSTSNGPFIGTVAMFGWNGSAGLIPTYENVRNSENWDCIINRTYLTNPINDAEDGWTDWISTNCFNGENDMSGNPIFTQYPYFVIEFYSVENITDVEIKSVTFDKIKILYDTDASLIYYNNNGIVDLKFPAEGCPGPGGTEAGYLTESLLNNSDRTGDSSAMTFPLYAYTPTIEGIDSAHGYNNGNTLAYTYEGGNGESLTFIITVTNAANGLYSVTLDGSTTLIGEEEINMAAPVSLDTVQTYTLPQSGIEIVTTGTNYRVNDTVRVLGSGSTSFIDLRVTRINTSGGVIGITPVSPLIIGGTFTEVLSTELITSGGGPGTGLTVRLTPVANSSGSGATISIASDSNLTASASFIGNRIDTSDINRIDQSIIERYNHFTTFVEFKQPEIVQQEIVAQVALSTSASISSSMIIQNIRNNLQKLFDITPDYMGKGLALSDIYKAITKTANVEWCRVLAPTDNVIIRKNQLLICKNITIQEVTNTVN